ncbi:MAG TPA: EFR1 family ferrodoxin [Clostridia bacterium]|nr:EFR1 family ferrodoxin [Clostridia bacterium]
MTVLILYFSGTGNTRRIAEDFKACLIKRNLSVIMHSIEERIDLTKISYDYLIIGCPKYYEYPAMLMLDYLKQNLQRREKLIPSMAFCTQASPLKTDFTGFEKLLRKKNHQLTVEASFPYANNMMIFQAFKPTEPSALMENQKDIRKRMEPLLDAFLKGQMSKEDTKAWQRPLIYMVAVTFSKLMPVFAMKFSADESCIHCGLCVKRCPMENIRMVQGNPVFQKHCLFCMRCINSCPVNAIRYNKRKCWQYKCEPRGQSAESKPSALEEESK